METDSKITHFLEGKKIIVAGSGFAGLAFVVTLRKLWDPELKFPEIVVYDRDSRELSQKREGYSLSLNGTESDSGLIAMRDLGLLDETLEHAVASVASFRTWDKDWNALMARQLKPFGGLPTAGIRIARKKLRDVLIRACDGDDEDFITWDTACTSAERLDNGRIRVQLQRGDKTEETDECDLLVAADGAHSKLRAAIRPDDRLIYRGVVQIGGVAAFPNGKGIPPPVDASWGLAVSGQGVGCFMAPVDTTRLVWTVSRNEARERTRPDTAQARAAVLDEARQIGHMLRGPFPAVVEATDASAVFVIPARDKVPFAHGAGPRGIVFVGDSNHAVSPFAGNGTNLALRDGWDLAAQLCRSESLDEAVKAYDELAVPRAMSTLKTSHRRMGVAHCSGI